MRNQSALRNYTRTEKTRAAHINFQKKSRGAHGDGATRSPLAGAGSTSGWTA
jgi:hypothetical protein